MPKRRNFKPTITRIKLNAEQAVLLCHCYQAYTDPTFGHFEGKSTPSTVNGNWTLAMSACSADRKVSVTTCNYAVGAVQS